MSATSPVSLLRPLTRRPAATTVTVKELIQKVQAGEVRIPAFQRPLRWTRDDVVALLDSVWRGYPVGSLLFWKRPAPAEHLVVGNATLAAPEVSEAWWVVDGQQRTTALAAALLDLDHANDARWSVRFDPEREQFLPGPPRPEREGVEVPGSVLGDLRRLGRWMRNSGLDDAMVDRIEDAQQRILDFAIPAYVVDTEDEQALRAVFARLNSTGKRMRADEVFQALLGAPSAGARPFPDLDLLQRECDVDAFGQPPRAEILKAVLAMSGMDPTRRLEDLGAANVADFVSREDATAALSRTVEFLMRDCGIPHVSLIPYPVVFFILSRWFHVHSGSEPTTRRLLARWVWRGASTGAHERAAVSKMREQVRDIQPGDEVASLDRLLARVGDEPAGGWTLGRFDSRSARSRIETLSLLDQHPQDRLGAVPIGELMSEEGRIAREIFASREWDRLSDPDKELARTAANRVILGGPHTGLHTVLRDWSPDVDVAALASHLIDATSLGLLVDRKVGEFLRRRAGAVRRAVDTFLSKHAAWEEPQIRPLRVYLEPEDD